MILDIGIFENGNGGEVNLKNNDIETIGGLTNQVYLALFGGNKFSEWWGNSYIANEVNKIRSTFETALMTTVLNSAGLNDLENAALFDLQYLKEYGEITVVGSLTAVARAEFLITITQLPGTTQIKFVWDGTKKEIIEYITI